MVWKNCEARDNMTKTANRINGLKQEGRVEPKNIVRVFSVMSMPEMKPNGKLR